MLKRLRLALLLATSVTLISIAACIAALVAAFTLFRRRRLYAAITTRLARLLLRLWGVRLQVHGSFDHARQVVYVSNHSSTIDLFALVALGLPNTRFFLSGFLQKIVPLGILARLMGTFFTVPQDRPEERRRIFSRACDILRDTGESVYASPEGGRIVTGEIGPFNKGAFHLASSLRAPIVPLYFVIPKEMDPGMGYDIGTGLVQVFVKPPIDTADWTPSEARQRADEVRALFVDWHRTAEPLRLHAHVPQDHAHVEVLGV